MITHKPIYVLKRMSAMTMRKTRMRRASILVTTACMNT